MDRKNDFFVRNVFLGALATVVCGAFIEFYPFLGDDIAVREIQFCTVVICTVMAICTSRILKKK